MAVILQRRVDYPMIDNANIAYYPRIYDLAHRFFEECWEEMCGTSYPKIIEQHRLGFPVVNIETNFIHPLRYGDVVTAEISVVKLGVKSCTWQYDFYNQEKTHLWSSKQVTVCVDMDSLESTEIPDWLAKGLSDHLS
tara:strand:- start:303 stop:713 length:411 start_codon:yes stop_codon:yes gene_type:complete